MSKLFKERAFRYGFLLGFILFLIIHVYNFWEIMTIVEPVSSQISIGLIYYFGFPFPIFEWNHYSPIARQFYFLGLAVNMLIALIFSIVLGLIFKFIWSKISARKLK